MFCLKWISRAACLSFTPYVQLLRFAWLANLRMLYFIIFFQHYLAKLATSTVCVVILYYCYLPGWTFKTSFGAVCLLTPRFALLTVLHCRVLAYLNQNESFVVLFRCFSRHAMVFEFPTRIHALVLACKALMVEALCEDIALVCSVQLECT